MLKLLSAAIVATGVAATALGTFSHADTPTNKDLVREALKTVFQDFDADAARKMFREDYIQHQGAYTASHLERLEATEDQSNLLTKISGLSNYLNEYGKEQFNVSLAFVIANCAKE